MQLQNKSAVVTGGGNGIGRAIALALAAKGANVAVADIEIDAARQVADEVAKLGVKSLAVKVDVTQESSVCDLADAAWEAFGSVELLVNNAGVIHPLGKLVNLSAQDYDWTFGVNVGGVLNGIRIFGPRFIESGGPAWIVNTGSENSFGVPHLNAALYTASKHAVLGLSDVLRRELPDHVGVSVLCPGLVHTTLNRAGARRTEAFGGPLEVPKGPDMSSSGFGMTAQAIGEKVITGIEQESFYIVTHPPVVEIARERWEEIEQAFAEQAPRHAGDEIYDTRVMMSQARPSK